MLSDPRIAFSLNFFPATPDNCAGESTAMLQMLVGRIDDGSNLRLGQVAMIERERLAGGEREVGNQSCHGSEDCNHEDGKIQSNASSIGSGFCSRCVCSR